jgi:predicted RNase H-like HicB family nuclease
MPLQRTIKAVIRTGEQSGFVAECLEIPVVTQGASLDEVSRNLRQAVALHLEGEDLTKMGLAPSPSIIVTFELESIDACPGLDASPDVRWLPSSRNSGSISFTTGRHLKLQRTNEARVRETLTIPDHGELDTGTCRAVLRQATRYVPSGDLEPFFYS